MLFLKNAEYKYSGYITTHMVISSIAINVEPQGSIMFRTQVVKILNFKIA